MQYGAIHHQRGAIRRFRADLLRISPTCVIIAVPLYWYSTQFRQTRVFFPVPLSRRFCFREHYNVDTWRCIPVCADRHVGIRTAEEKPWSIISKFYWELICFHFKARHFRALISQARTQRNLTRGSSGMNKSIRVFDVSPNIRDVISDAWEFNCAATGDVRFLCSNSQLGESHRVKCDCRRTV